MAGFDNRKNPQGLIHQIDISCEAGDQLFDRRSACDFSSISGSFTNITCCDIRNIFPIHSGPILDLMQRA